MTPAAAPARISTREYWPEKLRVLISYAYKSTLDGAVAKYKPGEVDLMVDSGAFTAFTKGKKISLEEYTDWLIEHKQHVTTGVVLDVIGDWKGTARNHERMLNRLPEGFPLKPVWHSTSPISELERLCKEYDYIGIGGLVSMSLNVKAFMQHMIRVHKVADKYGTKLHGLGVTGETAMLRLPWNTVDSSSWLSGSRYGRLRLRDASMKSVAYKPGEPMKPDVAALLRLYGGNTSELRSKGYGLSSGGFVHYTAQYEWMQEASARSYMLAEGQMRKKHDTPAKLFLAVSTGGALQRAHNAFTAGNPFGRKETPYV